MHYSFFEQVQQDADQQLTLENKLIPLISLNKSQSTRAFNHHCPGIISLLEQEQASQRFALFCNRLGNPNVVELASSAAVYSLDPQQEAEDEAMDFISAAPFITITSKTVSKTMPGCSTSVCAWPTEPMPESEVVVMMFGLGLGLQIIPLLQHKKIRCLVIYEPDVSMLQCSMQAVNWQAIFNIAANTNTLISLQIGKDASNVASDIGELCQHFPDLDKIYLYRHLSHPVMDDVMASLFKHSGDKSQLLKAGQHYLGYPSASDYLPVRFLNVLGNKAMNMDYSEEQQTLFAKNQAALLIYYPAVAELIQQFVPHRWQLVWDHHGNKNLWHKERNALLHWNATKDAQSAISYFLQQPPKNDVVLGQKVPWKFRHYIHYKAISELKSIFTQLQHQHIQIPQQVDSLVLFGIGNGNVLTELVEQRNITNLYVCEPNIEHFYASLYCIDWGLLLQQAEQDGKRLYLNIGGDGSNYFDDLMQQFYAVGAFTIANTYLFQANSSPALAQAVKKLKAQLGVVLSIGDYYDHARFGISHTYHSLKQGHHWLRSEQTEYLEHKATQLPVFIVGNGPSLDQCADFIKEHRHNVIVVSCGTALKPLYQLGITPDFHAEVEQNRSTYRWITQVDDRAYLKKIRLLSVNGVHPDISELFASTYLAFKEGEASTTLINHFFQSTKHIAQLSFSYPTVANLAVNWMVQAGFKQLYLLGVDLGYVDIDNHHSRLSGYYKQDGTPVYDYGKVHSDSLSVAGNFRPVVQTKIEFDVSRQVIEQTLNVFGPDVEVYNCSDGALIQGATPLQPAQILTFNPDEKVSALLDKFLQHACITPELSQQLIQFKHFYHGDKLSQTINLWRELIAQPVLNYETAKMVIDRQWAFFRQQAALPGSITFYLLYGSTSYFLSLMTKLLPAISQTEAQFKEQALEQFNTILDVWRQYLLNAMEDFQAEPLKLDCTQ